MKSSAKKILLLVNLSRNSGRTILSSVLRFVSTKENWRVKIAQVQEHTPNELIRMIEDDLVDGIISSELEIPAVADALERSSTPLSIIGTRRKCLPKRKSNATFITYNEVQIGSFCADYLLHIGKFKSYAFVHYDPDRIPYSYLSMLRRKGFRNRLLGHGIRSTSFGDAKRDAQALDDWLKALPKPCAILSVADVRAIDVVSACDRTGIRIPGDVTLLGIDNHDYLCLSVTPTLTSVRTNLDDVAYEAAKQLDRMMRARSKPTSRQHIVLPAHCEVIERESCRLASSGVSIVSRAKSFIAENARKNLTVRDVIAHLGVSRRLAFLRFRETNAGRTILNEITDARLNEVAKLLKSDTMSITQITHVCGFTNPTYLKTLFKRKFGLTMRDYRARKTPPAGGRSRRKR